MARLSCRCLNVSVFVTNCDWQSNPLPASKLFSGDCNLKEDVVYEVNLDVAGIVKEVGVLAYSARVEDWIINSCSNCDTDVYITHAVKGDRMLVFPGVLSDEAIKSVCQQKGYSSIYKVLLKPMQEDRDVFRRKRVSSMSFGREDPAMKLVHQEMKEYLKLEEEAMEERIRSFEEIQRQSFFALQDNAHIERSQLFLAIAKAQEYKVAKGVSEKEVGSLKPLICESRGRPREEENVEKPSTQQVTITIQDKSKSSYSLSKVVQLPLQGGSQEDPLFALDGFDEEQAYGDPADVTDMGDIAFPQSDDEDSSTNDSSFRDVSTLTGINLATSVPVGIPLFKQTVDTSTSSCDTDQTHLEGGDVGTSIRQLALSVQDTGMFGDLPRPRMMTNPFS